MTYYKNYTREYIGASDSARLLIEGVNNEGIMDVKRLNFGEDGSYNAYVVDANFWTLHDYPKALYTKNAQKIIKKKYTIRLMRDFFNCL